ncbi:MAG: zf-HC2 domain-containing protein [Acidobacteriota bacterium]
MSTTMGCDDKERLVAYLYEDLATSERLAVERHLAGCAACAAELESLGAVRGLLAGWTPPDAELGFEIVRSTRRAAPAARGAWASALPVWAQVAAAALVVAAGAAIANVQVRYGAEGLSVTTGWLNAPQMGPAPAAPAGLAQAPRDDEWRAALAALEEKVQRDLDRLRADAPARAAAAAPDEAAVLRRVNALIEASEQRQRKELAYRLSQMGRDFDVQRRADLVRIERGLGQLDARAGAEAARQRQLLNYVMRASTQPVP